MSARSLGGVGRWVALVGGAAAGLALLGGVAAVVVLGRLEIGPIRTALRAQVRARTGVDLDYGRLAVRPWGGLDLEGLTVATPAPYARVAPVLARIGRARVTWDLGAWVDGRPALDRVELSGVELHGVADDVGGSSLLALLARVAERSAGSAAPPDDAPLPPPSATLSALRVPPGLEVGVLSVAPVRAAWTEVDAAGRALRRYEIVTPPIEAHLHEVAGRPVARVALHGEALASLSGPHSSVRGELAAGMDLAVGLDAPAGAVTVEAGAELVRGTLGPPWPPSGPLLALRARATFDPGAGRVGAVVDRLDVLAGAITLTASASAMDAPGGGITVAPLTAEAAADVAKVLSVVPAGVLPLPIRAASGVVTLKADGLALDPATRLPVGGRLALTATVAGLEVGPDPGVTARAEGVELAVRTDGFAPAPGDLPASRGDVSADLQVAGLDARTPGGRVRAGRLGVEASASLTGGAPYAMSLKAPASSLSFAAPDGRTLLSPRDGVVTLDARGVVPDPERPERSLGHLALDVALGDVTGRVVADRPGPADPLTYAATVRAPTLGLVGPLLPPAAARQAGLSWERLGIELASKGAVAGLSGPGGPTLDHDTTAVVTGVALARPGLRAGAERVEVAARTRGGRRAHAFDVRVEARRPRWQGWTGGSRHTLSLAGSFDLRRPEADVRLDLAGDGAPRLAATLKARFEGPTRTLEHEGAVEVSGLSTVAALLPEGLLGAHVLDLGPLAVRATAKGSIRDVVRAFRGGVTPLLADDPVAAFRGTETVDLAVTGLRYAGPAGAASVPDLRLRADVDAGDGHARVAARLLVRQADAALSGQGGPPMALAAEALDVDARVESDSLGAPRTGRLALEATLGRLRQTVAVGYDVGDVVLSAAGRVERGALVRLDHLRLRNGLGGSALEARGVVETGASSAAATAAGEGLVPGREAIEVTGTLTQDLAALAGLPDLMAGPASGAVGVRFAVSSADRRRFRVAGALEAADVSLDLPALALALHGVDGRLPVVQDLAWAEDGTVTVEMGAEPDAWSGARFQDIHPFVGGDNFLSIRSLSARGVTVAPLAGNMRLDRNLLFIDQLEARILGGDVTGQLMADARDGGREVRFRGAVSGLLPTRGRERLDANAAVRFRPAALDLEGRVRLVRIGRQHLLDLLDLLDPYAEDVAVNRARLALRVGWPRQVRLTFDGGFLSAHIELGGVAGLASIGDIRAVPVGPALQRFLGPLLASASGDGP